MEDDTEESSKKKLRHDNPPATAACQLTDDLILEILSRLPARSLHRFKCVSTSWRELIADPVNWQKLPQTLAGFLYTTYKQPGCAWSHHFVSVSGSAAPIDPSLSFLQPNKYKYIAHVDSCNGLLLCACYNKETSAAAKDEVRYVVCNPATGRWIKLPPQPQAPGNGFHSTTRLAFDPTVSSHLHVLEFGETIVGGYVTRVDIFSSQTRSWIRRDSMLVEKTKLLWEARSLFFGGMLHFVGKLNSDEQYVLLVVDMEGKAWKTIHLPVGSSDCAVGLSQGCFYYASATRARVNNSNKKNNVRAPEITLWCLENYDTKKWVLKHSASIREPLGITRAVWRVFAIHPDCDTVFLFPFGGALLVSYNVQQQKFVLIHNFAKLNLPIYLPYVPLFSEALADADGQQYYLQTIPILPLKINSSVGSAGST